jgi:quercetin dioxygenase-like cupin family protein
MLCINEGEVMKKILCGIFFILLLTGNAWVQEVNTAKVEVLAKTSASWDGNDLPNYPKGTPEITILRIKIPPKVQLPLHKHPVINAGVLLKGELTVVTEGKEILHLKAGDSIVEVVDKWHYGKNEGNETAEIIVFYAGVQDSPITIKK